MSNYLKEPVLQKTTLALAIVSLIATISFGIYMAQPWGDNYAYQNISGYLGLAAFLTWACSPYFFLIAVSKNESTSNITSVFRLIAALIICSLSIFMLFDTAFINIDAQGALVFIFLPIYQWVLFGLVELIGRFIGKIKN